MPLFVRVLFSARLRFLEVAMQQSALDHTTGQINLLGYVLHAQFSLTTIVFPIVSATDMHFFAIMIAL